MITTNSFTSLLPGRDCRDDFRAAYENRYTWEPDFSGYQGTCLFEQNGQIVEGCFTVGADLKAQVSDIKDNDVHKAICGQLWEVAIHRVRRSFNQTHGQNTFTVGENDNVGMEVIVGGKNIGDRYRIKNNIVTMVHRNIHGNLITIFTESVVETGKGYLSRHYTSQYSNPKTGSPKGGASHFSDTFMPICETGPWVLTERIIQTDDHIDKAALRQVFRFNSLISLR